MQKAKGVEVTRKVKTVTLKKDTHLQQLLQTSFEKRIFSVCTLQYFMFPPVRERVPLHSKSLCKNMAGASGGAKKIHPLSWVGYKRKRLKRCVCGVTLKLEKSSMSPQKSRPNALAREARDPTRVRKESLSINVCPYGCNTHTQHA